MKRLLFTLFAAFAVSFYGCGSEEEAPAEEEGSSIERLDAPTGASQVSLKVGGMKCGINCPPKVESALMGVEGVDSVVVNFDDKSCKVVCDEGVDKTQLVAALDKAGFEGSLN